MIEYNKLTVGNFETTRIASYNISSNLETVGVSAVFRLPRNTKKNKPFKSNGTIKKGDSVTFELGYQPKAQYSQIAFKGYVKTISTVGDFIELNCENEIYNLELLKCKNFEAESIGLKDFIKEFYSGKVEYSADVPDLGKIRVNKRVPFTNIIDLLKTQYEIYSQFRGDVLYINPIRRSFNEYTFVLSDNNIVRKADKKGLFIFEDTNRLTYKYKTDTISVIKGVSRQKDESVITSYAYYDNEGVARISKKEIKGIVSEFIFEFLKESVLNNILKEKLQNTSYNGLSGSFDTFIYPIIAVNDVIHFVSEINGEISSYYCNGNNIYDGRQSPILGRRIK